MELLQLKYFCHAARTENFSKTAKEFHVPQSNISQSIKRLEDELSASLFTRKGNRVVLNERGRAFYQEVSEALEQIENAKNAACGINGSGKLRIGIRMGRHIVMKAVSRFQKQFPQVDIVTVKFGPDSNPDEFDLIIADGTDSALETDRFTKERIFRDRLVLVTAKDLLSPGPVAAAGEMREQSFITLSKESLMYRDTLAICRSLGFKPRITLQSENSHYIPQCVALGLGVALAPELSWAWTFPEGSVDMKLVGDFFRDTYVYRRKRRYTPQYMEQFYELLLEAYGELGQLGGQ